VLWSVFLGTALIIFVVLMPDGIVGRINRILYSLRTRQIAKQYLMSLIDTLKSSPPP
jgi:hypothetical protein